jgi:hypothetical protein
MTGEVAGIRAHAAASDRANCYPRRMARLKLTLTMESGARIGPGKAAFEPARPDDERFIAL